MRLLSFGLALCACLDFLPRLIRIKHHPIDSAAMQGSLKGNAIEEDVDLSQATVELNLNSRSTIPRALHAAEEIAKHAEENAIIAAAIAAAAADSSADLQAAADAARKMFEEADAKKVEAAEMARKARESAQMAAAAEVAETAKKSNNAAAAAAEGREPAAQVARMSLPAKPFPFSKKTTGAATYRREPAAEVARMCLPAKSFPFSKQKTGSPPPLPSGRPSAPGVGEDLLVLKASVRLPPPKQRAPLTTSKTNSPSGIMRHYIGPLFRGSSPY